MGFLDSPQGVGGALVVLLGGGLKLLTAYLEWRKGREVKRATSQVPPSPQLTPPTTDPHALARLDRVEHESALSVALVRERQAVDDLRRELVETRAERDQLTVELRAAMALIGRLRVELVRAKARSRSAAVEVGAAEHRDASQAGPLQDAIRTPLRPPAVPRKRRE
jgi:hypothetical protein